MELRYGNVRRWRAGDIETAYTYLNRERHELLRMSDELAAAAQPSSWRGEAAAAARRRLGGLNNRMEQLVAEVAAAVQAIGDAADEVATVTRLVAEAEEHARRHGLVVADNGEVAEAEVNFSDLFFFERRARKSELREMITRIMRKANEVDDYLTSVFERIIADRIHDGGASTLAAANDAGRHQGTLHSYLIHKYQVTVDPGGTVLYPQGLAAWTLEQTGDVPMRVTRGEADLLDDLGLAGLKDSHDIYKTVQREAETIYQGQGSRDGHSDAFRHAYWNAMLANRFGQEWTEQYTTAHERVSTSAAAAEAMDLYNNEVGRRIAADHPDAGPQELRDLVDEAMRRGELVVVDSHGQLVRSNEVDLGGTSEATGAPGAVGFDPPQRNETDDWAAGYHSETDGEDGTSGN